ncbi:MAG: hypothetical protein ACE5IY_20765 [bacterium]
MSHSNQSRHTLRGEGENRLSSNSQSRVLQDALVRQAGYALGAEIGLAGNDWDFVAAVSFQRPGEDRNNRVEVRQVRSDTSFSAGRPPTTSLTVTDEALISRIDQSPAVLGWKSYYQKKIGWFGRDANLFLSLNAYYVIDSELNFEFRNVQEQTTSSSDTPTLGDTLVFLDSGVRKGEFWDVQFSAGYVVARNLRDLYVLVGLNPGVAYTRTKDISDSRVGTPSRAGQLLVSRDRALVAGITVPFYFDYAPLKWGSVYGGVNYSFVYHHDDLDLRPTHTLTANGVPAQTAALSETTKQSRFDSSKHFYLGLSLRHKSGIVALVDLNGNLAGLRNWNFSVGYHF